MKKYLFPLLLASSVLGACSAVAEFNEVTAERLARPAFMVERKISNGAIDLQAWERMHTRYAPANVYIEGDGGSPLLEGVDPTPENPVALHLASRDHAENLVYLARPCQYMEVQDEAVCPKKYWTTRRFSPEVFAAYNAALDDIKARYNITGFNLVGYDGGANIAAVLTTQRNDILSLRTVAGNLTPSLVYDPVKNPMDPDSLKISDLAPSLANVPQHHFIGAGDTVTPPSVYHSFAQTMGGSTCMHYTMVPDADHERGWVEKWPSLQESTTACAPMAQNTPLPPRPLDTDVSHGMK